MKRYHHFLSIIPWNGADDMYLTRQSKLKNKLCSDLNVYTKVSLILIFYSLFENLNPSFLASSSSMVCFLTCSSPIPCSANIMPIVTVPGPLKYAVGRPRKSSQKKILLPGCSLLPAHDYTNFRALLLPGWSNKYQPRGGSQLVGVECRSPLSWPAQRLTTILEENPTFRKIDIFAIDSIACNLVVKREDPVGIGSNVDW